MSVLHGDCLAVMPTLDAESVDAIVCDPPYGLGFMGKAWDHGVPGVPFWEAALRVAKPGAHLAAFGGTRTYHRLTVAIEDAGWEIRDCLSWLYGSGFPKSHNGPWGGTALKPAWEPIILARKPLRGTVAANVAAHGTGALNIDGCRIATDDDLNGGTYSPGGKSGPMAGDTRIGAALGMFQPGSKPSRGFQQPQGRWPANVCLDEDAAAALDAAAPSTGAASPVRGTEPSVASEGHITGERERVPGAYHADIGGASRFFYTAKASRSERDAGLTGDKKPLLWSAGTQNPGAFQSENTDRSARNNHPTVKPLALMRWLCKLVTPAGGLILDPFTGSGSTGCAAVLEGFGFLGIEQNEEYVSIARARIAHAASQYEPTLFADGAA